MNLWFRTVTEELCSWSIVLDNLARTAKDLGHNVVVGNDPPAFTWKWLEIWWGAPQDWVWHEGAVRLKVGLSLSESDQLGAAHQQAAIRNLKRCDILFAPSQFAMQAFLTMPIDVPIHLWRFGVDTNKYVEQGIDFTDRPFRFLLLGATQFRKGSWLAAEAFVRAFEGTEPVRLTVATFMVTPMFEALKEEYKRCPQIEFISEAYSNPLRQYDNQHILLSPHLSEGWGLCIPEAMALGMPCIVSRCSTPREYFSEEYGWWVEMSDEYAPIDACLPGTSGFWRLPSVDSLAERMRYAYEHRSECETKSGAAIHYADNCMQWKHGMEGPLAMMGSIINEG